ncbi:MAG: hypothetical protein RIC89_08060, partial [Pseudomonadales bacterium]
MDNRNNGYVGNELKKRSFEGSKLAVLSSLFTIYGYATLRKELSKLSGSRLLLTDWQNQTLQSLIGTEAEVRLTNQLNQRRIARECAKWIRGKVEVKASRESHRSSQNLIHLMANSGDEHFAVHGSTTLTPTGLGEVRSNGLQMNTGISDTETTLQLLAWFDGIWSDEVGVADVRKELLERLDFIAAEQPASFIYFLTLYNIFKDFLEDIDEENIIRSKTGFKDTLVWNKQIG